jgi:hypothetical protein
VARARALHDFKKFDCQRNLFGGMAESPETAAHLEGDDFRVGVRDDGSDAPFAGNDSIPYQDFDGLAYGDVAYVKLSLQSPVRRDSFSGGIKASEDAAPDRFSHLLIIRDTQLILCATLHALPISMQCLESGKESSEMFSEHLERN